ncbi:hypothetical protein P8605_43740 [Streptomyces sp. T-3]|nr:hypothetical protein [Streptomyces sp. T-3]
MNRALRTAACALAATGLALGLTACSEVKDAVEDEASRQVNQEYEVTYEVTGKGVDRIEFSGGGGEAMKPELETVSKPELPWKKTVTLKGLMPPSVMPYAADLSGGDINCKITYQGKVLKEASGQDVVTGCVAVSPVAGK